MTRSKWDPNSPVEIDASTVALEGDGDDRVVQQQDVDWWKASQRRSGNRVKLPEKEARRSEKDLPSPDEDLDLLQRSLDILDYPKVLQALTLECSTVPAKRIIQQLMRAQKGNIQQSRSSGMQSSLAYQGLAADTVEGSQERYRAVQELQRIIDGETGDATYRDARGYKQLFGPPPLQGACNVEPLFGSHVDGAPVTRVLDAEDITQVRDLLGTMQSVRNWGEALRNVDSSRGVEFVELSRLAESITVNTTLRDLLDGAFERSNTSQEQKRLSGITFPILSQLRSRVQSLRGEVLSILDGLLALPSTQSKLALESGGSLYSEVAGRLVIPVQSKYASMGIVHDTSRSGKTVYVEPTEIVAVTNELKQVEGELRAEEGRIWRMLSNEVYCNQRDLELSACLLGQLDLVHAKVQLGIKFKGVTPEVQNEGVISVRNAKHPVLLLRHIEAVGSTIELGADGNQGLVLTGPNSGTRGRCELSAIRASDLRR
jgi:DNA mismatch repair protein MutS2